MLFGVKNRFGRKQNQGKAPRKVMVVSGLMLGLILAGGGVMAGNAIAENTGIKPLSVLSIDEIGKKQEAELLESGIPLNGVTLSQFSDGQTNKIAAKLYDEMQKADSGKLIEYEFEQIATAKRVITCLAYEYLGGSTSPVQIYKQDGKFIIGWSDADEVLRQNDIANLYIDNIFEKHKEAIEALETDKEKADYIAKVISTECITHYDDDYQIRTIYQLSESGNQVGVCTVYTTLMDRLCERAGITSYMEIGVLKRDGSGTHCWNRLVFSDGTIHIYDLTSYASVNNINFLDMSIDYYDNYFQYRKLNQSEFGYKAGVNELKDDDEWF